MKHPFYVQINEDTGTYEAVFESGIVMFDTKDYRLAIQYAHDYIDEVLDAQ